MVADRSPVSAAARTAPWLLKTAPALACVALSAVVATAAHGETSPLEDPEPLSAGAPRGGPRLSLEGSVEHLVGLRPQLRQGGVSTSLIDASNRVWLGWGRASFGVGIGTQVPQVDQSLGPLRDAALQPARTSMSVGWRYRLTDSSMFYAGATAARDGGVEESLPLYRAKAGVEWKVARSKLGFDGGRLGLQLDSGYRMSIRTRSGGLQIALRRTF